MSESKQNVFYSSINSGVQIHKTVSYLKDKAVNVLALLSCDGIHTCICCIFETNKLVHTFKHSTLTTVVSDVGDQLALLKKKPKMPCINQYNISLNAVMQVK